MDIYKKIQTMNTVADLRDLQLDTLATNTNLANEIKAHKQTIRTETRQMERKQEKLDRFGSVARIRDAFRLRLGEITKDDIET